MKDQFLIIIKSLTEGFDKNESESASINSGLSIERASKREVDSLKEAIKEFNRDSRIVKVKIVDRQLGVFASPTYTLEIYKEKTITLNKNE